MVLQGLQVMSERWSYSLTPSDEATSARVGYLRQEPMLGQPHRNTNYSEGDLYEVWQHGLCAASELALARMLGLYDFVPSIDTYKTELDIPGYCEVRYKPGPDPKLRICKNDKLDQVYVLMSAGINTRTRRIAPDYLSPPFVALGWLYGSDALNDPSWRYNQTTCYVPVRRLNDMDNLPWE
jgi:hypothetical protein